jgi:hypothetical protein
MDFLALIVALSAPGAAPAESAPIGDEIFVCDFDNHPAPHPSALPEEEGEKGSSTLPKEEGTKGERALSDRDYDGWPDGWTRELSLKLPEFVKVAIVGEGQSIGDSAAQAAPANVNRVLRMELDGGGAAVSSPAAKISPQFSLLLSVRIRAQGLKHDRAWARLTLQDSAGQVLQTLSCQPVEATGQWQRALIGPITPASGQAARAVITLHVGPVGAEQDLTGSAEFDDVRLLRLPRMSLAASSPTGLFDDHDQPVFTCDVSGIRIANPEVRFELLDFQGQVLATHTEPLVEDDAFPGAVAAKRASSEGFSGRATWKPELPGYGFYHLTASLLSRGNPESVLTSRRSLAMLRPLPAPPHSEFGWSLPAAEQPYAYGALAELLGKAGLGWAKVPVWYDAKDVSRGERVSWFAEQVSIHGIELVGVLDQPPEELRQVFREPGPLAVASVFMEPELWEPVVNPVLTRLSLRIRWWQLGNDQDTSFVGLPQVESRIAEIKHRLEQSGQEIRLGVGWRWQHPVPPTKPGRVPWTFLSYYSEPQLTADELSAYLPALDKTQAPQGSVVRLRPSALNDRDAPVKWLVLAPLPRSEYSEATRIQDLVRRMLAARIHAASAAFVPHPFDDQQGLLNADGSPGELFVPWRTTASLVGGAEYLGQVQLPGGSTCQAFGRENEAILAIWNDHHTTERVPIEGARGQIDVWGRNVPFAAVSDPGATERELQVGPLPTFLTGSSTAVARWQADLAFDSPLVASVFNVEQSIGLKVRNPFEQGVGGQVKLIAPASWGVDSRPVRFKVGPGEELKVALPVTLLPDADSGPQQIRLDFELTAEQTYKFSVYRTLQLGLEDVRIELSTKLREDGALIVEQQLINFSDQPVSFQCLLFPPGRRREIRQVINAGDAPYTTTYVLPRGAELIDKRITLRAEEIGGVRVLNHAVTAER